MKKYLLLYNSPPGSLEKMAESTPEQKTEEMKVWLAWKDKMADKLVDFGAPMMSVKKLTTSGQDSLMSKHTGYSIIRAENAEEAVRSLSGHPHLSWTDDAEIQVFECFDI